MKIKRPSPFATMFRRSRQAGLWERTFSFLFTLSCGWAVSGMLDTAQAGNSLFRSGMTLLGLLAVGLPTAWLLSRWAEGSRIRDRQLFREALCGRILENQLEVRSIGEQELLLVEISDQVAEQYQVRIPKLLEGLGIIVGATALMCRENLSIGILFVLMGLIQIIPVFTYEKWTKKIYEQAWDNDEAQTDWITQGVDGLRTLKSYGAENWFVRRYEDINRDGILVGCKAEATGGLEDMMYASIDAFLRYGSYLILGLYVLHGRLSAESLPVLVVLSGYVFSSMDGLFTYFRYRATYRMAIDKLRSALRQSREEEKEAILQAAGITKAFEEKQVLKGIDLTIHPRERVLLQGLNGSGKSTLLKILLGELTPDRGEVRAREQIAVALQEDPALPSPCSVFVSALKKRPDWHEDRFLAHLRGFRFPEALLAKPTQVLSGGERKKFYLAAALAREADLLILDEPTNHLDGESRTYLKNVLAGWGSALLVCTHDPALALNWDQTITLEGGENHG